MGALKHFRLGVSCLLLLACSSLEPRDRREHHYTLRLTGSQLVTVDYEVEVSARDGDTPIKVATLFHSDIWADPMTRDLNVIATSQPGYAGVTVIGVNLSRLQMASTVATVTAEILMDGRVAARATTTGGTLITNLKAGSTF